MAYTPRRRKIAVVTTTVLQVNFFLVPHLNALQQEFDVTLVLNNDHPDLLASLKLPVRFAFVDIERKVSPWKDLLTLFQLARLFRRERFDMVHSVNPKAGLLGMLAAWLVKTPVRAHIFQGEVWANKTGVWRFILRNLDRLVSFCATHLTVVSHSERDVLVNQKIISARKSRVLANGSIGGVDLHKFQPNPEHRASLRKQYGYTEQQVVYMYLGRLTREKGLVELASAFEGLASMHPSVCLHVVGPDEDNIVDLYHNLQKNFPGRVQVLPFSRSPQLDLQVADVLMLPSHREGFGVVVIEAAALGVPSIGSRIYGISDAILDQQTGLMFTPKDPVALAHAMEQMLDPGLRDHLGRAAQLRVQQAFDQQQVLAAFIAYHRELLREVA
ncbi:MAG TPA: glycosyltransferase family 4 protein [Limnobacter sp.]|nr:glycosyltransferase family 4 protein [Limnobacter sp.]